MKTIADPEAYMIRLRFIAGLQNSEHKLKVLEHLQQNPDATIDDILLVIQQREQTERTKGNSFLCAERSITKEDKRKWRNFNRHPQQSQRMPEMRNEA